MKTVSIAVIPFKAILCPLMTVFSLNNSPCKSPHLHFSEVPGWQIQCRPLESLGADRRACEVPRGGWGSDVCLLAIRPCLHHPELLPPPVTGVGALQPGAMSWILFWAIPWRRDAGKVCHLSPSTFPTLNSVCWLSDLHQDAEIHLRKGGTQEQGKH